ncbi:MAG TPA: hypothetical protein VNK52_16055 [Hyphomicrobiaceae bacterium]|nr:hypothetical protein [Hyphomicrobiaceae bacterium]
MAALMDDQLQRSHLAGLLLNLITGGRASGVPGIAVSDVTPAPMREAGAPAATQPVPLSLAPAPAGPAPATEAAPRRRPFDGGLTGYLSRVGEHGLLGAIGASQEANSARNQTYDALVRAGLDDATAEAAVRNPTLMQALLPRLFGPSQQTADIQNYQYYAQQERAAGREPKPFGDYQLMRSQVTHLPAGWERMPDGTMRPTPGGPADPAYLAEASAGRARPRQFSLGETDKLRDEGTRFANLARDIAEFRPEYAGYIPYTGNLAMAAGRNLPEGIVGQDTARAASWWQNYKRNSELVERHELFGAALTATEQAQWRAADINPDMQPEQIVRNLERRREILTSAMRRRADALIQAGYDPAPIAAAYGIDLRELGVTTGRQPGSVNPTAGRPSSEAESILNEARAAIARGANRERVIERLREQGVDPSGL